MSGKLRVGVIGVGHHGHHHARIYAHMPDVELVGVSDIDAGHAERAAADYDCEPHTDPAALVDRVDAVSVVVPTQAHAEVALPYIERGVHVLMEKPIAPDYASGERLVQAAAQHGIVFQVGHLERFNAGVQTLAAHARDPRFIEAHRLSPFVERATDVDVITDLMIHDIDIVLALVPAAVERIAASGVPVLTEHVDIANARLEFTNGAVANITSSRVSNKKLRRIRVFESSRYLGLNFVDQQIDLVTKGEVPPDGARPEIITERLEVEPRKPLDEQLKAFVDSVRSGTPPLVTGAVALEALRVVQSVQELIQ